MPDLTTRPPRAALILLLISTLPSLLLSDPKHDIPIHERVTPLYTTHKDVLRLKMYLSRDSQTAIDFKKRMDFSSISSNFSTNCDYIEPPGVVGRHQPKKVYFKDEALPIKKVISSVEGMVMLHENLRKFTRLVYDPDHGLMQREVLINRYLDENPHLECRDVDDVKEFMFYLCYDRSEVDKYIEGRQVEYQIVVQHSPSNNIVKTMSFYEVWIPNLEMNAVHMKGIKDRVLIMLFSQQTPELGKGQNSNFKSNPRIIFIWLLFNLISDGRNFRILNTKMMNLENEIMGTNKDNFEIRWIKVKKNQNFFLQYRILHDDYSMDISNFSNPLYPDPKPTNLTQVNYLKMCRIEIPENFNLSSVVNCNDIYPEAEIYFFDNHSEIITMVDTTNQVYFCRLNKKRTEVKSCKSFQLETEWELKEILLKRNVGLVNVIIDEVPMNFIYYYNEDIMTWIDHPEPEPTRKFLRDLNNDHKLFLLEFGSKGMQVFDLEFRTYYTIDGKKVQDARTIEIYLEGQLINETRVFPYTSGDIVDTFHGFPIKVVRDPITKAVFTNLGFSGANLNYHNGDQNTVFKFTRFNLNVNILQNIGNLMKRGIDITDMRSDFRFLDLMINGPTFYITTEEKIYSGQLFLDDLELQIDDFNMKVTNVPETFELDIDRMVKRNFTGNEIMYFFKEPFDLFVYKIVTGEFYRYQGIELLNQPRIHNCNLSERVIFCNKFDDKMFPQVIIFEIGLHVIEEAFSLNAALAQEMEEYRDYSLGEEHWTRVDLIMLSNTATNIYRFNFVFNLVFLESMVTRAVHFLTDFSSNKANPDAEGRLAFFGPHKVLDFSNLIRPGGKVFSVSGLYIIHHLRPKFEMVLTNERLTMSMPYFDASHILLEYVNKEARIYLFVYKNLEDGLVYMVLLNITQLQERQVLRHEEMKYFSDTMRVNMMRNRDHSMIIIIYDYRRRMAYKTYIFRSTATLVASVTDHIIINGLKIPLFLEEDETVVQNNFLILHPLVIELADFQKDDYEIILKNYIEIRGNVSHLAMPKDHNLGELEKRVGFRDFIFPIGLIMSFGKYEDKSSKQLRVVFTQNRMIGNFQKTQEYEVYLRNSFRSHSKISFDLGHDHRFCLLVVPSEDHLFCFFNFHNKSYVMAKRIVGSEDMLFKIEIQPLGEYFEILQDSDDRVIFGTVLENRRAIRIDYIDKKTLRYDFIVIDSYDFGVAEILFVSVFMHFEIATNHLTFLVFSNTTNHLFTYTGEIDTEDDFVVNKVSTLREYFSMNRIDVNILKIKCKSMLSDMEFECILLGRNFIHEIHLSKTLTADISIFSWKLSHLYSYTNVFFTEMSLGYSDYDLQFGPKHLLIIIMSPDEHSPGRMSLYHRFKSRYSLDSEDYGGFSMMDTILAVDFDVTKRTILVLGSKNTKIVRRQYGVQKFSILISNVQDFVNKLVPFEFFFTNGKSFRLEFLLLDSSVALKESDFQRDMVFAFLIGIISIFFIMIFGLLIMTVMAARVKERLRADVDENDGLDSDIVSDSSLLNLFRQEVVRPDFR